MGSDERMAAATASVAGVGHAEIDAGTPGNRVVRMPISHTEFITSRSSAEQVPPGAVAKSISARSTREDIRTASSRDQISVWATLERIGVRAT